MLIECYHGYEGYDMYILKWIVDDSKGFYKYLDGHNDWVWMVNVNKHAIRMIHWMFNKLALLR